MPELVGCAANGQTQTEALKNVNEAVELWLETAKEFGDKIPEPRQHRFGPWYTSDAADDLFCVELVVTCDVIKANSLIKEYLLK